MLVRPLCCQHFTCYLGAAIRLQILFSPAVTLWAVGKTLLIICGMNRGRRRRFHRIQPAMMGAGLACCILHCGREANPSKQELLDVLMTDAPGEWFDRWAVDRSSPQAAGARWVAEHADSFALLADSEALIGADRGEVRRSLRRLAQRAQRGSTRPTSCANLGQRLMLFSDLKSKRR